MVDQYIDGPVDPKIVGTSPMVFAPMFHADIHTDLIYNHTGYESRYFQLDVIAKKRQNLRFRLVTHDHQILNFLDDRLLLKHAG